MIWNFWKSWGRRRKRWGWKRIWKEVSSWSLGLKLDRKRRGEGEMDRTRDRGFARARSICKSSFSMYHYTSSWWRERRRLKKKGFLHLSERTKMGEERWTTSWKARLARQLEVFWHIPSLRLLSKQSKLCVCVIVDRSGWFDSLLVNLKSVAILPFSFSFSFPSFVLSLLSINSPFPLFSHQDIPSRLQIPTEIPKKERLQDCKQVEFPASRICSAHSLLSLIPYWQVQVTRNPETHNLCFWSNQPLQPRTQRQPIEQAVRPHSVALFDPLISSPIPINQTRLVDLQQLQLFIQHQKSIHYC